MLHSSSQDPAAQQESVNLVAVVLRLVDQGADKSIVPKAIDHPNHKTFGVFTLQEVLDLLSGAPDGREIELICSESQLRDAIDLILRQFANLDAKLKAFNEVVQGERLLAVLLPLRALLVH